MAEVLSNSVLSINSLPENLLLDIFTYLSVKDLCTVGRVCRAWRRITSDNKLWRHVDLQPYRINLHRMWKVIRSHFSNVLQTLYLRGYMHPDSINWKKTSLSDAMLCELQERCPNLRNLGFSYMDMSTVSISRLPCNLTQLKLTCSSVPPNWFHPLTTNSKLLQNLQEVDMSGSSKTCNPHLKDLSSRPSLQRLHINGCYRVTEDGLQHVTDKLTSLVSLQIRTSACTDLNLHHMGRRMKNLLHLDLGECKKITSGGLSSLSSGCKDITWLSLHDCSAITDSGLIALHTLKKLRHVDVQFTSVTQEGVEQLKALLPECDVVNNSDGSSEGSG